jgi:ribosomal protein S12 methylthiotransferase accessory factor
VIEGLLSDVDQPSREQIAWVVGTLIHTGEEALIPADWCLRRSTTGALAIPGSALSTGCAAGPNFAEAASRALLELIERDAAALWWVGGRRGRPIGLERTAIAEANRSLTVFRQGRRHRITWLLDITSDLGIPCVAALSCSGSGRELACGLAARWSLANAANSAIKEMCQMELARPLLEAKLRQGGENSLNETDRRHLKLSSEISSETCALLHPFGAPALGLTDETAESGYRQLLLVFEQHDIEVALITLTRHDIGVPVVCAVAPNLQKMPGNLRTVRLCNAIAESGGGERWTKGIGLM